MAAVEVGLPKLRPEHDEVDAEGLAEALVAGVRGEVAFDTGARALYSTDASNYRQVPIGVLTPLDVDDVVTAVAICRDFGAPVTCRGGGTSLAGQCTNKTVIFDLSRHVNQVESVNEEKRTAIVQAGVVLDELNKQARKHGGLVFGPKPATHDHCTLGGMIGNNSCGSTAQWSGTTAANVRRLEVLTYDGLRMWVGPTDDAEYEAVLREGGPRADIYRKLHELRLGFAAQIKEVYPNIPRRISGYNLPDLLAENGFNVARALVGSESTCVILLRAEVTLLPEPTHVAALLAGYSDIATAAKHVPLGNTLQPYVFEGIDHRLIEYERKRRLNTVALHEVPDAGAWLLLKLTGEDDEAAHAAALRAQKTLERDGDVTVSRIYTDKSEMDELDSVREAALGATARVPGMPDTWPGWEDSAVSPDRLSDYLIDLQKLLDDYGYGAASLYGHFGHGCVHTSIPFDLTTTTGIAHFRSFVTRAARLVVSYGGSLSGEHGDGQARGELLSIMFGDELVGAMREFKAIFDPAGRMNPGKIVDPNPLDSELRLGVGWPPERPETQFAYPEDGGFAGVPTRCFGVGACRRHDSESGGVMCPSYMVTREEKHSTRGRMRLLFEMMRGETITDGWQSEEVAEALDLCLACKGCKSDCPVSVDMATYKSEFLSHHFEGRRRPISHYSLGWLPLWARLAAVAPRAANAVTHAPGLSTLAKMAAGVDVQRDVPRFARTRFTTRFRRRKVVGTRTGTDRGHVLLWPDTFTNNFSTEIAISAVVALEAAGFTVHVPQRTVCCGLTWISTGQLGVARSVLCRSLDVIAPYLDAGMAVVGLEPSCTSVLRADAYALLRGGGDGAPTDRRYLDLVDRLQRQTVTFAELLDDRAPDFAPQFDGGGPAGGSSAAGTSGRPAIVQRHCHHHAVLGNRADEHVMKRIGLDAKDLASGCCGLAGDFGMTPEHRDVSMACAERALFPALDDLKPGTLLLADGFSCRVQVAAHPSKPRAYHLAEVVAMAAVPSRSVTVSLDEQ